MDCPKCGYERTSADELIPEGECPKCGAIYSRVESSRIKNESQRVRRVAMKDRRQEKAKGGGATAFFVIVIGVALIMASQYFDLTGSSKNQTSQEIAEMEKEEAAPTDNELDEDEYAQKRLKINCEQTGRVGMGLDCQVNNSGEVVVGSIVVTVMVSEEMIPMYESLNDALTKYEWIKQKIMVDGPFAPKKKKQVFIEVESEDMVTVLTRVLIYTASFDMPEEEEEVDE